MRVGKILITAIFIFLLLICVCYCYINVKEAKLEKEGNEIVRKIELFRNKNNRLPSTLEEIGIKERDGLDVLYYYKRDSVHYTVSFPISAEEHKFYYSDSQKWEKGYREMK